MEKSKDRKSENLDNDLENIELDTKNQKKSNIAKEDGLMDDHSTQVDDPIAKTARLAKINLGLTVVGLGILGFLHFSSGSAEEAIANSKAALKQEIAAEIQESMAGAQQPQLQAVVDKSAELEAKVDGHGAQLTELEMKVSQFQVELDKNASLRNKVAELQASVKKGKPNAKPSSKSSSKPKSAKSGKTKKPGKKGKK